MSASNDDKEKDLFDRSFQCTITNNSSYTLEWDHLVASSFDGYVKPPCRTIAANGGQFQFLLYGENSVHGNFYWNVCDSQEKYYGKLHVRLNNPFIGANSYQCNPWETNVIQTNLDYYDNGNDAEVAWTVSDN